MNSGLAVYSSPKPYMDKKVAFGLGFQGFEYLGTKNKEKQWVHSEGNKHIFRLISA